MTLRISTFLQSSVTESLFARPKCRERAESSDKVKTALILIGSIMLVPGAWSQTMPRDTDSVRVLAAQWTRALIIGKDQVAAQLVCPSGGLSIEKAAPIFGCARIRETLRAYLGPGVWAETDKVALQRPRDVVVRSVNPDAAIVTAYLPQQVHSATYSSPLGSCVATTLRVSRKDGTWRIDSAAISEPKLCGPDL